MSTGLRAARVRQGIAVMDLHHGPGWVWRVDPGTLDMGNGWSCVVGQVNDCAEPWEFFFARRAMGLEADTSLAAGFRADGVAETAKLTRIWSSAIRLLREQRPREVGE